MDYISFQLFTIDWAILHVYNAFTQKNEKKMEPKNGMVFVKVIMYRLMQ